MMKGEEELVRLEDLLFTLEICRKSLPTNAHPVHCERLRVIEDIIERYLAVQNRLKG